MPPFASGLAESSQLEHSRDGTFRIQFSEYAILLAPGDANPPKYPLLLSHFCRLQGRVQQRIA